MTRKEWRKLIEKDPYDFTTRLAYADWLEEKGKDKMSKTNRWIANNKKVIGPPCTKLSYRHELTWFKDNQKGVIWEVVKFPKVGYDRPIINIEIKEEWCLPYKIFLKLTDYIRQKDPHNEYARSYYNIHNAEWALANALELVGEI